MSILIHHGNSLDGGVREITGSLQYSQGEWHSVAIWVQQSVSRSEHCYAHSDSAD